MTRLSAPASSRAGKAKPSADFLFHSSSLLTIEMAKTADELGDGHCDEALSIEAAGSEEPNAKGHLETRAAQTGGMRDERHEGAIRIFERHADDERGAHLRREAQVDEPNLAALRGGHRAFSA